MYRGKLFLLGLLLLVADGCTPCWHNSCVRNEFEVDVAAAADGSSRQLLEKWGRLHAVRTAFGIAAAAAYLWALN